MQILLLKRMPTEAQIRAGNYRKGHIRRHGLEISIENPKGSVRSGVDPDGKAWRTVMRNAYGYVRRTEGVDGDHVDVFIGPKDDADEVHVVHQHQIDKVKRWKNGKCPQCRRSHDACWHAIDEDKAMVGFPSREAARRAYLAHYNDPRVLGPITSMPVSEFVAKVRATKERPRLIKALFGAKKPTICLDFDGVLHGYQSGWQGETVIPDPPVHGSAAVVAFLRQHAKVVVHSARTGTREGRRAVRKWLRKHSIRVDGIAEHKPPAAVYVDDLGLKFNGDWAETLPVLMQAIGVDAEREPMAKALLVKAYVRAHTRHVNGKTVRVAAHNDKRMRRGGARIEGGAHRDLFDEAPEPRNKILLRVDSSRATRNAQDDGATSSPSPAASGASKKEGATMKKFDRFDLEDPRTYEDHPELATLARKAAKQWHAAHNLDMPLGEFKREVLAGKHPDIVAAALASKQAEADKKRASDAKGSAAVDTIEAPMGYSVEREGSSVVVRGPFDEDLNQRIRRAGGRWDGTTGTNRRLWIVPAAKGASLKRVLANFAKKHAEDLRAKEDERAAQRERADQARREAPGVAPGRYGDTSVRHATNGYHVAFRYAPERVSAVKQLSGSRFNPSDKSWFVDARHGAALRDLLQTWQTQDQAHAEEKRSERAEREAQWEKERQERTQSKRQRVLHPVGREPALNEPVRWRNRAVVFTGRGQPFRIDENEASMHGSHLLGHEGERGRYSYYRDATPEEAQELAARETARAQRDSEEQVRSQRLREAQQTIQSDGERPADGAVPVGEPYHDTMNVYGGGSKFVIGPDYIWYIQNNGADGDDWARNNVDTGGAGAIGWRVPYDRALADRIKGE